MNGLHQGLRNYPSRHRFTFHVSQWQTEQYFSDAKWLMNFESNRVFTRDDIPF